MSKLSLDALKERAEAVASTDLLNTISGGTENSCHPEPVDSPSNYESIIYDIFHIIFN
jgi:hypothetical protein